MRLERQEFVAVSVAALLHGLALVALHATLGDYVAPPPLSAPSRPELTFDVDYGELAGADPSGEVAGDVQHAQGERVARFALPRSASGAANDGDRASAGVEAESSDAVTPELVELEEDVSAAAASGKPLDLGIGPDGWQRWVAPSKAGEAPRAEGRAPRKNRFQVFRAAPVSTTGGLQEGLEDKDRALGLGPSGRVLSAAHAAAHITAAPYVGVARFDVTVHRTGVVEVTLGGASRDVEQWKQVAAQIASELRASPPRIPPPRDGVKLVLELVAEETMPNGTKITSLHGPRLDIEAPKLKSTQQTLDQLIEENPTTKEAEPEKLPPIQLDLPGVYLAERGKVCSYRLGLSVMGPVFQGGCDPAHIGAKPQRMVRARVVEQQLF